MAETFTLNFHGTYDDQEHVVTRSLTGDVLHRDNILQFFTEFLEASGWVVADIAGHKSPIELVGYDEYELDDDDNNNAFVSELDMMDLHSDHDEIRLGDKVHVANITGPDVGPVHDRTGFVIGYDEKRPGGEYEVSFPGWKGGHNGKDGQERGPGDHWYLSGAALEKLAS